MPCGGRPSMRLPSNQISPLLTGSIPLIVLAVVVLPAPFAPSRASTSPSATVNETSCRARNAPYWAAIPLTSSSGRSWLRARSRAWRTSAPPEVPRYTAATCGSRSTWSGSPDRISRPPSMTASRSQHSLITSMTCSTIRIASTSWRSDRISSMSSRSSDSIRPAPISSSSRIRGRTASARASSRRLRRSRPRSAAGLSANSSRPQRARIRSHSARAARPPALAPCIWATSRFSITVIWPNGRGTWCVRPTPRRARSWAPAPVTSSPKSSIRPSPEIAPDSRPMRVLLPAPFGPIMPSTSPPRSSRSTRLTARTPP